MHQPPLNVCEPNDGFVEIPIPNEILITEYEDPILAIVQSTYPDFLENYHKYEYLKTRAILASTIEVVDQINDFVLGLMPGTDFNYLPIIQVYITVYMNDY